MTWTPLILWTPPIYIPLSNWLSWAAFSEIVGQNQLSQWSQIDFTRGITMKAGFVFFVLQEHSWEVFWAFLSAVIGQVMIKYIKELIEDAAAVELGQSLEQVPSWILCQAEICPPMIILPRGESHPGGRRQSQGAPGSRICRVPPKKAEKPRSLICLVHLKRLKRSQNT